ncbi:RHOMBOID-like protein 10, chloroplastic [Cocos nucifera]|uniref:RHOMBOID-like protein 10, chloroplastic n=1 Tax=Cocos nucifera TaxID=13894 RepID=A0A8K0ITH7_COCNU|nr:RHOMBOID-like protein 10, chloroplastic [Cocos nucifera]
MFSIPPRPWLPASNSSPSAFTGGVTPAHLITVASALRLGDLLRGHFPAHLTLLLCSPSPQDAYRSDNLPGTKDIWCRRPYLVKKYSFLETVADTLSASCSSCFSFFSGKESERGYINKGKLQFKGSEGNVFDGRLWTNVLLAINVLVYAAQIATQGKLLLWGAKVNSLIDKGQLWRFATSSFMHANIGHLMVNCFSLNSIGPAVEKLSGPRRFLAFYFSSAITSSMMSYRFCQSPAVGASGAIFGLVGSFAVFVLRHRGLTEGGKQDLKYIAQVIALNMVLGLLCKGIDNWGHLGGLLGGMAMSWFLGPAWQYECQTDDGRLVFADRAPVFYFIRRKRLR